ncbi:MAG: RluA family pseudouridine synthase [Defluviitaleaceae bacterium]|nr:RluA family pseudouridine synthase [Defluviitaleaceae bacterium]
MSELHGIDILYRDDDMIVVRKPPGMPCQPDKTGAEDMVSVLTAELRGYIGLVHRLDRPVGGLMVFARNPIAGAKLSAHAHSGFGKEYLAVVRSDAPPRASAELRNRLVKDERTNMSRVADNTDEADAKPAVLDYTYEATANDRDGEALYLLRVNLRTGRHHQVRVQLAHAGMPIWGDAKYGAKQRGRHTENIALWSCGLSVKHPRNGQEMAFRTLPEGVYPFDLFALR